MALNPKIKDWQGQRVWLIGASSGIGAALVPELRAAGARLALSARRESALMQLSQEDDKILSMDVTLGADVESAYESLESDWGGVDWVFYCAGTYTPMRSWNVDADAVDTIMQVNLLGVYSVLQSVLPDMLHQGHGGLCFVGSVAGYTGLPEAMAYGPSKAALINLCQVLYADLSDKGLGVYLVNPGFVETRLTDQNAFEMPALIQPEEAAKAILKGIAKGQFEIDFPKRFTRLLRCVSRLPDRLRFALIQKVVQG